MSLFRLVYASTSLLSDEPDLAREQIEQILLVSRRNTVPRVEGDSNREVKLFSLWAPKCTARIGTEGVHPTEIDRSIMIASPHWPHA